MRNLYVHFPFCRQKCAYCALYSRPGADAVMRANYVRRLVDEVRAQTELRPATVYFGGGTPALCDLSPLGAALRPLGDKMVEFTVELHPLDVTEAKLAELAAVGVNRISMGVESLDDATLSSMGRGYTIAEAERAFALVKRFFDNAGIDLIVGYPGDPCSGWSRLKDWGLRHCSVYALQNERGLKGVPTDDWMLDQVAEAERCLGELGLERYEISNYAVPGFECRHNLAVWRGEDYLGLGEGACGRVGLRRTRGLRTGYSETTVTSEEDFKERTIFRLRTCEGFDFAAYCSRLHANASRSADALQAVLSRHVAAGLLKRKDQVYFLTSRGREVCDSILLDLM